MAQTNHGLHGDGAKPPRVKPNDSIDEGSSMGKKLFAIMMLIPITVWAGDSVYVQTLAGKKCWESGNQQLRCTYTVGKDLEFEIGPIGDDYNSIAFIRSSYEGDFWATFGMLHGCVIVKAGRETINIDENAMEQYAFVSPKNGKVYADWIECKAAN